MNRSVAHGPSPQLFSADSAARADFCLGGPARFPYRWKFAVAGAVAAVMLGAPGGAQTPAPAVRPEFRTAPRTLVTQRIDRGRMVRAEVAIPREARAAQDLGARDPSAAMEHIQLVLQRPRERQAAFDAEAEALHQPGSPEYHRWLTPEVVGAEFGPSSTDIATLTAYLQEEGFTVNAVGKSGMFVDFSGTVAQVQQSFHTVIDTVRLASGEDHYAAMEEVQIPEALVPLVAGFVSLSDIPSIHSHLRKSVPPIGRAVPASRVGASPLDTVSSTNYAVGPQDFYTIYNELPLLALAKPIDGTGVTIALLEESAITTGDVAHFRGLFGVNPATPVSLVTDTGFGGNCC